MYRPHHHSLRRILPFPIYPTSTDILREFDLGLDYLIVSENTSFTMFASDSLQQIMFHQYSNSPFSEWRFESYTRESQVYYRIRNVYTGMFLAIDPYTGASVGYRLILTTEERLVQSVRASWEVVRNRNGSFSIVSLYERLSITFSYEVRSRLELQVFAGLPSQHFFFYDFDTCRRRALGQAA